MPRCSNWKVVAGETWPIIAAACGTTKEVLWQWNSTTGGQRPLVVGEVLLVPLGS